MDPLYRIERPLERHDEWEELVSQGMEARELKDKGQWMLGEIADKCDTRYGQDALGQLATAIGVNKRSLARYRDVYRKWRPLKRNELLSFSHHMIAGRAENPEQALEEAYVNSWSCEKLADHLDQTKNPHRQGKPPAPEYCYDCHKWKLPASMICSGH